MKLRQYYIVLLTVFLTVLLLSVIWEFWAEDLIISTMFPDKYQHESVYERLEYVVTVSVFVLLSLIIPGRLIHSSIIKQQQLHNIITRHAEEDYLTGLANRRKISELLQDEINRARRYQKTFSIILIDIDYFKHTNDTFGHRSGDNLLIDITGIIGKTTRLPDMVGRWGGEEFVVICPETDLTGASCLAEKIREKIENNMFGEIGHKTASFGVTCYNNNENIENIIQRADMALYSAKRAGRNKVEIAKPT